MFRLFSRLRRSGSPTPTTNRPISIIHDSAKSIDTGPAITRAPKQVYRQKKSDWQEMDWPQGEALERGSKLHIVSWNIDFAAPEPARRAAAAMKYLQTIFDNHAQQTIFLLQEVCDESRRQILETPWVQQNFVLVGGSGMMNHYFTMILVPEALKIHQTFRMAMPTRMGRDALFVDIELVPATDQSDTLPAEVLRLCSVHLESLGEGTPLRNQQLEMISEKLSNDEDLRVVAGIVGGDMNAIESFEATQHLEMGLTDAWDEPPHIPPTSTRDHKSQGEYGQNEGHTWGYQPLNRYPPKRFDKFYYAGSLDIHAGGTEAQSKERIRRLGIGLRLNDPTPKQNTGDISPETSKGVLWVSDHFGIAIIASVR